MNFYSLKGYCWDVFLRGIAQEEILAGLDSPTLRQTQLKTSGIVITYKFKQFKLTTNTARLRQQAIQPF